MKIQLRPFFLAVSALSLTAIAFAEKKLVSPLEGKWRFVSYEMEYRDGSKLTAEDAEITRENTQKMLKAKRAWLMTEDKDFETITDKAIYLPMVIKDIQNGKEHRLGKLRFDTPRNFRFYWANAPKAEKFCYIRELTERELVFVHTSDTQGESEYRHIVYRFVKD